MNFQDFCCCSSTLYRTGHQRVTLFCLIDGVRMRGRKERDLLLSSSLPRLCLLSTPQAAWSQPLTSPPTSPLPPQRTWRTFRELPRCQAGPSYHKGLLQCQHCSRAVATPHAWVLTPAAMSCDFVDIHSVLREHAIPSQTEHWAVTSQAAAKTHVRIF